MRISNMGFEENAIFRYFEEISKIPRVSGNTAPIANYLVDFAKQRGLKCYRDGTDNVVIYKSATKGFEGRSTVILQGHSDMVGAIAPGVTHDFSKEGPKLVVDGDIIRANGTTLGADDGIAVAYMLALLDGGDGIEHPPIECVFTSDEETGLLGATALDGSVLSGRVMINLDSGPEGTFIAGCAGGVRIDLNLDLDRENYTARGYSVHLYGFKGGHSGEDIHRGRLNAIREIALIASRLSGVKISEITGGAADNVIAYDTCIRLTCKEEKAEIERIVSEELSRIKEHECGATVEICEEEFDSLINEVDSKKLLGLITSLPFGIYAMSKEIEGVVETSNNIGVITVNDKGCALSVSVRSSVNEEKLSLAEKIENIAEGYGATHSRRGDYPGWKYDKNSRLCEIMCRIYKEGFCADATVAVLHAGLECGLFQGKLDGLDCISMGCDYYDLHTAKESLSISSFIRTYKYLKQVLREI